MADEVAVGVGVPLKCLKPEPALGFKRFVSVFVGRGQKPALPTSNPSAGAVPQRFGEGLEGFQRFYSIRLFWVGSPYPTQNPIFS